MKADQEKLVKKTGFNRAFESAICKITAQMKINCDVHGSQYAIIHEGDVYCKACYDEKIQNGDL